LVQLVPATNQLAVRLYAPSKAAGFVRASAPVLLRFDAYPYQKYGQLTGKVVSVSKAAVNAADIQAYASRADLAGESLFTITVNLPEQMMGDPAQKLQLQAGMRVEADLLHETGFLSRSMPHVHGSKKSHQLTRQNISTLCHC
jgi:membrane fusion protein